MKNQLYKSIVTYTYHADIYCYLALDNSRNFLGFRLPKQASINAFIIMYAKPESACGRGVACFLAPHKTPLTALSPQRYCFFPVRANKKYILDAKSGIFLRQSAGKPVLYCIGRTGEKPYDLFGIPCAKTALSYVNLTSILRQSYVYPT